MFFTAADRLIYECSVTARKYDPLAVKRAIAVAAKPHGGFNALVAAARGSDADAQAAQGKLIAVGRAALGLPALDAAGNGVLDATVFDALTRFTEWLSAKKSKAQSGPDSAPCTSCP